MRPRTPKRSPFFPPKKPIQQQRDITPAEADVARLLAEGWRCTDIAKQRGTELRTVQNQVNALKRKTNANTIPEMVVKCLRAGTIK